MKEAVDALEGLCQFLKIATIGFDKISARREVCELSRDQIVDDANSMAEGKQVFHKMGADESRTSRNEPGFFYRDHFFRIIQGVLCSKVRKVTHQAPSARGCRPAPAEKLRSLVICDDGSCAPHPDPGAPREPSIP